MSFLFSLKKLSTLKALKKKIHEKEAKSLKTDPIYQTSVKYI